MADLAGLKIVPCGEIRDGRVVVFSTPGEDGMFSVRQRAAQLQREGMPWIKAVAVSMVEHGYVAVVENVAVTK